MISAIRTFALLVVLSMTACDSTSPDDSSVAVVSISVSSSAGARANYLIPSGQESPLGFIALDASGSEVDDADVTWSSSNSSIVSVATDGTIVARNPGVASVTVSSGIVSGSVELTVFDVTGTWMSAPDAGNNFVTMELTQTGDAVAGTFTYSAWTSTMNSEVGHGPIDGTLIWDRFVHEADVAQGCVWKLKATISVVDAGSEIQLKPSVESPAWQITSTCGGGGSLAIADLFR